MKDSPLRMVAKDLPFFKTVDKREQLLGVVGALVLRKISLSKASEIMEMDKDTFLGLLEAIQVDFSYLEEQDVDIERGCRVNPEPLNP